MSNSNVKLCPELQQLIDDFVSVRQRFTDLAETFVKQKIQLQRQKNDIDKYKKEIDSIKEINTEKEKLAKSYDKLKLDYELLYSTNEKQRNEIQEENEKHIRDLDEKLKIERLKCVEQAEMHKRTVADYESKLRDADEKLRRHLIRTRDDDDETSGDNERRNLYSPEAKSAKIVPKKKWPELPVRQLASKTYSNRGGGGGRGRGGRPRGSTTNKRKLFVSKNETPVDIL